MNNFDKWSISIPKTLGDAAVKLARKESRTRSELVREALRKYLNSSADPVDLSESPSLTPRVLVNRMRETGLYSDIFLDELKVALSYADKKSK